MDCEKCIHCLKGYPTDKNMFCVINKVRVYYSREKCSCFDDGRRIRKGGLNGKIQSRR